MAVYQIEKTGESVLSRIMAVILELEYTLYYSSIPFLIIGLIGNVLVIRIVHKTREMHTPTNYLLASMAVSDVIIILLWSLYFFEFEKFICKFVVVIEISIMVSSNTLTVIAVERYHAVLKPFSAGLRLSADNINKTVAFIWAASIIMCFPEFFLKEWSEEFDECVGPWSSHMNQESKIYIVINAAITYMQLAIMFFCYGGLMKGLYFDNNRVYPETDRETSSEKKKLVITFILATTGFFVGYMPTVFLHTFIVAGNDKLIDSKFYSDLVGVFDFMFVCSLCLNPIIYGFRGRKFQEELKRITFCPERTPQNEVQSS